MPPSSPQKLALLIGLNYVGRNELSGCINDVLSIQQVLAPRGFTCRKMIDSFSRHDPMYPDRRNILVQLRKLVLDAQPGDTVFLHYSGHGTATYDSSGDEFDRRDEAICPARGGLITDDEIRAIFVEKLPSNSTAIILLDCCHAGTGADLRYNYEDISTWKKRSFIRRRLPDEYYAKDWAHCHTRRENTRYAETRTRSIMCISGCRDNQSSADTVFDKKACGAMTAAFLRAWHATKEPNGHNDGGYRASIRDVVQYMTCMLRCYRYEQVPQLSLSNREDDDAYEKNQAYIEL